jgi:hypothetical protein
LGASWLYDWLDEYEVRTSDQVARLLREGNPALLRLQEVAGAVTWQPAPPYDGGGMAILAGRGIDLSGQLSCLHPDCQRRQVDALFGRVLHYFDEIVVAGPQAHSWAKILEKPTAANLRNLATHADLLLYLRDIGAQDMLRFVEKRPACAEHYQRHAAEANLEEVVEGASGFIDRLTESGTLRELREHEDHWHYTFDDAALEHTAWRVVAGQDGRRPGKPEVVEAVFATYVSHLVSDVLTARDLGLPLGSSLHLH